MSENIENDLGEAVSLKYIIQYTVPKGGKVMNTDQQYAGYGIIRASVCPAEQCILNVI